jgi:hypothetical protein
MYRGELQQHTKALPITEERVMMNGEMDGWHWGFGFGHWIFGILFWAALILVVAAVVKYLIKSK